RQQGEAEDRPIDPARPREAEGRGEKDEALHVLRVVRGEPRGERTAEGEADEVNRAARLAAQGEEGLTRRPLPVGGRQVSETGPVGAVPGERRRQRRKTRLHQAVAEVPQVRRAPAETV